VTIKVGYDESIDSIVLKSNNVIKYDDVCLLRDQIITHPKFRKNIHQLFDSTESQFDLSSEELIKLASYYQEKSDQLGHNRKLAVVVSRDLDFGKMRQYEAFFDSGPNVLVQAFRSLLDAREWLKKY